MPPYLQNIVTLATLIRSYGVDLRSELIVILENDSILELEQKTALINLINYRYDLETENPTRLAAQLIKMVEELQFATWEELKQPSFIASLDMLREYVFAQLITYLMTRTGTILTEVSTLLSDSSNFTPPTSSTG